MRVFNIRYGFATNSSSNRSLIFLKDETDGVDDFGWEYFTAASTKVKSEYVACILKDSLDTILKDTDTDTIFKMVEGLGCSLSRDTYIDHQSVYLLPTNWEGTELNIEFFSEFKIFMLQDNLVILGGNDNDYETPHKLHDGTQFLLDLPMDSTAPSVARKEDWGWVTFNRVTGEKVRFSFEDYQPCYMDEDRKLYSRTPELVDLKITNYCEENCTFCYQSSTRKGKHAAFADIEAIAKSLRDMEVFEVAIGGGDALSHPDFKEIIKLFKRHKIVPNS